MHMIILTTSTKSLTIRNITGKRNANFTLTIITSPVQNSQNMSLFLQNVIGLHSFQDNYRLHIKICIAFLLCLH
jgi:hypothetical protein